MSDTTTAERPEGYADPAPNTGLNAPAATTVSSLLMEDAVIAKGVSVAPGSAPGSLSGKVALFANPFLEGKEEALVVDAGGKLTYLQRAATETGWRQPDVTSDGKTAIRAKEVVAVVHPTDQTVWAIYTDQATGEPKALELTPDAKAGTATWRLVPGAIRIGAGLSLPRPVRLSVYYDGRTPVVCGFDEAFRTVVTITGARGIKDRFVCLNFGHAFTGPIDDLAVGRVSSPDEWTAAIGYVRQGTALVRFKTPTDKPGVTIANDAARIIGVFPSADGFDIGCVYLDTAGNLVTWSPTAQAPGHVIGRTPGLGFVTATCWTDINLMLHVYGLDADNTLKVLHQSSWTSDGMPVWSRAKIVDSDQTVPVCLPLVPKVASFAVDPFPDHQPNQLVRLEGVKGAKGVRAEDDAPFSFYAQELVSARWSRDEVRLLPEAKQREPLKVTSYISTVTVLDQRGNPIPSLLVQISAESLAEIQVDGASYLVGPGHSAQLKTNMLGSLSIAVPADGLTPPTLHVDAVGLAQGAVITPAAGVQDYLAGTGTLASRPGMFGTGALADAKVDGVPLVQGEKNRDAIPDMVKSVQETFKVASGQPVLPKDYRGTGPVRPIHGFAFGSLPHEDPEAPARYIEFPTRADLDAHLDAIRKRADYGGLWDEFVDWAGDVWQGIKDGVVKVVKVVVESVVSVFIKIGEAVIELVGFVLDTVERAVHVVEALFAKIAVAVTKIVEWLKALFSFKDLWETKTALHDGLKQVLKRGVESIDHLGDLSSDWFTNHSSKAHGQLGDLSSTYRQYSVGDASNRVPTVGDSSGQAMDPSAATRDPQASWLLNHAIGAPAMAAARAAAPLGAPDSPVPAAFGRFLDLLKGTDVEQKTSRIVGDPGKTADGVADPRDSDSAAKASVPTLVNSLTRKPAPGPGEADDDVQDLLDVVLSTADDVVGDLLSLLKTIYGAVYKELDDPVKHPLDLGPLNTFYKWIQKQADVKDPVEPTPLGLFLLIGAFAVNTTYKLLNGVDSAPFPGGTFPELPAAPWSADYDAAQIVAPDPGDMRKLQIASGVFGILGTYFEGLIDLTPMMDATTGEEWSWWGQLLIATGSNVATGVLFGMVGSCPPVIGREWDEDDGAWSAAFAVQTATTLLSIGAMLLPMDSPLDTKYMRNLTVMTLGPIIVTALGAALMIATATAVGRAADGGRINDYAAAQTVLPTIPPVLQILRFLAGVVKAPPEVVVLDWVRVGFVTGVNILANGCSGLMMVSAAALSEPPVIRPQHAPDGHSGKQYTYAIQATGGDRVFNQPLQNWKVTSGSLPPGLQLSAKGVIFGVPMAAAAGKTYTFSVACTDSFGPPQPSEPRQLTIQVEKNQ